ncbi:amyloid beta A4 precursor protein-binding family B member 1-interacting protein-like, partial [Plectropomus leopardus]|uniref:amyloid beta A4 precursor protein-binding family B member 1-interacting protein-like n=1 Tax=Plectropomus leopardus TaxID=160734 RepID=UPI001C4B1258
SLMSSVDAPEVDPASQTESTFSVGFTDLHESLNELEDHDLDALVADLRSKSSTSEELLPTDQHTAVTQEPEPAAAPPPPSNSAGSSAGLQMSEPQTKTDKIKLALEKLKEAKVRKLIVKVLMSDGSSKTLMVDERQTVREVLDKLFEKTHCDCSMDWSLCETNPELQIERGFEDHEHLVEPLSAWTRLSENKIYFVSKPQKYVMFTDPQLFYMWKKKKACLSGINEQAKQLLIK